MKTPLLFIPILIAIALCSCSGPPKKSEPRHVASISVPGTLVQTESILNIRNPEDAATYHFGRMEMPGSEFMLEETKGYRMETESSWNLNPQNEYDGHTPKTIETPAASEALLADYEQRIKTMRDEFQEREAIIIEQNRALIAHNDQQQKQMQELQQLSEQLVKNQQQVLALKQQIETQKQAELEAESEKPWYRFWGK